MNAGSSRRTAAATNRMSIYVGSAIAMALFACVGASMFSVRAKREPSPPTLGPTWTPVAPATQPPLDIPVQLNPLPPSGPILTALATPVPPAPGASPQTKATTVADLGMDVIEQGQGVFVMRVAPNSRSEQGGLAPGDLLVKINNGKVLDTRRLLALVASAPGESMSVRVVRGGRILDLSIDRGFGLTSAASQAYQVPELGMEVAATGANRVIVHRVYKGSYAEQAGLTPGDTVLAFNGKTVRGVKGLVALVTASPPEKAAPIKVVRNARVLQKNVMIGEGEMETVTVPNDPASTYAKAIAATDPTTPQGTTAPAGKGPYQIPELGMEVVGLDADGVAVFRVYNGSFAEQAGLERGDFIFGFNGKSVRNLNRFVTLVTAAPPEQSVDIRVGRDGRVLSKKVVIGEGEMETATVPTDAAGPYTP